MSYTTGEALVLTRCQAATDFDATNTARANWQGINKGKSDHYAILRHGGTSTKQLTYTDFQDTHVTLIEVWQRYKDDGTTATTLYSYVAALVTALRLKPRLGDTTDTILDSNLPVIGQVEEMWRKGGGPSWLRQTISIQWQEMTSVTFEA